MKRNQASAALGCLLALAAATPSAALTPEQISAGFAEGVGYCLEAGLAGAPVAQLPADRLAGLEPAAESMRGLVGRSNPGGPLWDVRSAKGIVVVSEPSPDVCEVVAYGPPVDRTFKSVLAYAKKAAPGFVEVPVKPGYDPIVYRLERTGTEPRLALHLSGAEPGTPGHAFRFSLLSAKVTRLPPAH